MSASSRRWLASPIIALTAAPLFLVAVVYIVPAILRAADSRHLALVNVGLASFIAVMPTFIAGCVSLLFIRNWSEISTTRSVVSAVVAAGASLAFAFLLVSRFHGKHVSIGLSLSAILISILQIVVLRSGRSAT
ncbi:MAG TPA: hypothetical protein VER58_06915 [Thermoanaerobaculia bacterium]|nr:hypothetical protein [Thermoanaerobaculia bacterium]